MPDEIENAIEWLTGQNMVAVTLYKGRLQSRVLKLAEQRPGEVAIIAGPKENQGYLFAHVPLSWLKISPPRQMSEEQRENARRQLQKFRKRPDAGG